MVVNHGNVMAYFCLLLRCMHDMHELQFMLSGGATLLFRKELSLIIILIIINFI